MASSKTDESSPLLSGDNDKNGGYSSESTKIDDEISHLLPGGMSALKTAIFIIAQVAGSGILALPHAIANTRWTGIGLMIVLGMFAMYCGIRLGDCWNIVRKRYPIPKQTRDPYPLIGYYTYGKTGKYIVEICVLLTLIGSSVVYLIIASQQIASILDVKLGALNTERTEFRLWVLICGLILIPFTWAASTKEMWVIAYGATFCSMAACALIIIRSCIYLYEFGVVDSSQFKDPEVKGFFTAFGTIAFAYGGGSLLPTLQADMKNPGQFVYAAFLGFLGILLLYLPCSILPYLAVGDNVGENVLDTLLKIKGSGDEIVKTGQVLMTIHLLLAIVILSSPTTQLLEEKIGIPHKFGIKRVVIRTLIGLLTIGLAELFPNFGPVLSLIGASTITLLAFTLPTIFYLKLNKDPPLPLHIKVLCYEIIFISFILGCCGTYSAVLGLENPFKEK